MRDVIEDGPRLDVVPVGRNLGIVDPVEAQGQSLQEHQSRHDPMNPEVVKYYGALLYSASLEDI